MHPRRIPPGPGQESVWDFPRPPRLEPTSKHLEVVLAGVVIADTRRGMRVLETSHPPVYYFPPADVRTDLLVPAAGGSFCEWKGSAVYHSIVVAGRRLDRVVWSYPRPTEAFATIAGYFAMYAGPMDACMVDGERAIAQPGGFYGGWVTSDVVGPFKGEPGTQGW